MKKITTALILIFIGLSLHAQIIRNEGYQQQLDEQYASGLFKGTLNSYMIVPADDPSSLGSLTIFHYLQGRIPGLMITTNWPYNTPTVRWRMGTPAYFLDEMRVDASVLSMISINDIGLVKVFRPPFIGAIGGGAGGAIAVYTLRGDEEEE